MKRLMYATDFSEKSMKAFECAVETARKFKAEIVVTHVFQVPKVYKFPYLNYTFITEKANTEKTLNKLREIMEDYFKVDDKAVTVSYRIIRDSSAVRGLLTAIEEEHPNLLMLSAQGDNESHNHLFGGMIKTLVKQTSIPIMTIPDDFKIPDFTKVAFASKLYPSEIMAIKDLSDMVRPLNSEIHIIHVNRNHEAEYKMESFKAMLDDQLDYMNWTFVVLDEKDVYQALNDYIVDNDFGLLSMTEKEHGGLFYRFLHQDLIHKMEFNSTVPVLSFNENSIIQLKEDDMDVLAGHKAL